MIKWLHVENQKFQNNPFTGKIETSEDGMFYKEYFKDGKRDGLREFYHDNGQLSQKGNFKDGKYDGFVDNFEDGKFTYKICLKNGHPENWSYCEK